MELEQLPRGSETILLVEDDRDLRRSTARILEKLGYGVLQAADPDQAIHLATLSNAHLLLVDVVLPLMAGTQLAHKIARLRPGIRVLYTSGFTTAEILDDQIEPRPGARFLQKPFTPGELAQAVREVLDEELPPPVPHDTTPRGSEALLLVEDDPQVRRAMVRGLERLGYHVLEAQYPDRALSIALNARVELAVIDVALGEESGFTLARNIQERKPGVRVLFVSGVVPEELARERAPDPSRAHFLAKPFTPDELGRTVRAILDAPQG